MESLKTNVALQACPTAASSSASGPISVSARQGSVAGNQQAELGVLEVVHRADHAKEALEVTAVGEHVPAVRSNHQPVAVKGDRARIRQGNRVEWASGWH